MRHTVGLTTWGVLWGALVLACPYGARAEETSAIGGGRGQPFDAGCGPNARMMRVTGRASDLIKQVRAVCSYQWPGSSSSFETASHGGTEGDAFDLSCSNGLVTGFHGMSAVRGSNKFAGSIQLACGYGPPSRSVGWNARDVADAGLRECPSGTVPTGLRGRAGSFVDQLRFICGKPTPFDGTIALTLDGRAVGDRAEVPLRPGAAHVVRWTMQGSTPAADGINYSYELVKGSSLGVAASVSARGDGTSLTLPTTLGEYVLKIAARLARGSTQVAELVSTRTFEVRPGAPSSIEIARQLVLATRAPATLVLDAPAQKVQTSVFAPPTSYRVELKSSNPAAISVPASVTVPEGADRATFTATVAANAPTGQVLIQAGHTTQPIAIPGLPKPPAQFVARASVTVTVNAVALGAQRPVAATPPAAPAGSTSGSVPAAVPATRTSR